MIIRSARLLAVAVLVLCPALLPAQTAADDEALAQRLRREGIRHETPNAVLWVEAGTLTQEEIERFGERMNAGVEGIERLLGRAFDSTHYVDDRIQVFISDDFTISHVYGGYEHPRYDRPYLYLNSRRVRNEAAPYLHEATHILAWDFGPHSLREGFASYVETVVSAQGQGYASHLFGPGGHDETDEAARAALATDAGRAVLPWIGRDGLPDPSITSSASPETRAAYYVLSQSFVRYLVERAGLAAFMELYAADGVENAAAALTGKGMEAWKDEWVQSLTGARPG